MTAFAQINEQYSDVSKEIKIFATEFDVFVLSPLFDFSVSLQIEENNWNYF